MKKSRTNSFWLSYSDLMTSLFFVMLILFLSTAIKLSRQIATNESIIEGQSVEIDKLKRILQLDTLFSQLSASSALRYNAENKTFVAKDFEGIEIFEPELAVIKDEYRDMVDKVGIDLQDLLKNLKDKTPDCSYLLVIEGSSANYTINPLPADRSYNYRLSYDRALALYNRWTEKGINLRKYNTEIQICGSGLNGINRDEKEENNKRFVIQIIPKVSRPE